MGQFFAAFTAKWPAMAKAMLACTRKRAMPLIKAMTNMIIVSPRRAWAIGSGINMKRR